MFRGRILTEHRSGIHFASDPRELETDETVGELLPNLEAKVVDKGGKSLPRGQCGEIMIKTPFAMKKYLNDATATEEAFTHDGFLKTGDIGMVNDYGRWYVLGRTKVSATSATLIRSEARIDGQSRISSNGMERT